MREQMREIRTRVFSAQRQRDVAEGLAQNIITETRTFETEPFYLGLPMKLVDFLNLPSQHGTECSVCMESFIYRENVAEMSCCHRIFHRECLAEQIADNDDETKCFNCRRLFIDNMLPQENQG